MTPAAVLPTPAAEPREPSRPVRRVPRVAPDRIRRPEQPRPLPLQERFSPQRLIDAMDPEGLANLLLDRGFEVPRLPGVDAVLPHGRHKGRTLRDLALAGEFGYIRWLSTTNMRRRSDVGTAILHWVRWLCEFELRFDAAVQELEDDLRALEDL